MDNPLWVQLTAFTRHEIGGKPLFGKEPVLTPATRLLDDLRVDGDDAVEFLEKWFETFQVAGMENFPINRYFGSEGTPAGAALLVVPFLARTLWRALFRPKPPSEANPKHPSLTLGMLYEAARVGRWDTEAIEAARRPRA